MNIQKYLIKSKRFQLLLVSGIIAILGLVYWLHGDRYVSTEDAYVNANVVQVSTEVTGKVIGVYAENNQFIKKGALLLAIDPVPFQVAVEKAKAQFDIAQANFTNAKQIAARVTILAKSKTVSIQDEDNATKNFQVAKASLALAKAGLDSAELDLSHTKVIAPSNGFVSDMSLREGDVANANQPLFAFISNDQYWADANYKETELRRIKKGQSVEVVVDMYPNHPFRGVVDSISGGTGAAFSLLPAQNATGNWVKVAQRVPVKIIIQDQDPRYPLRIGTTATVSVDTVAVTQ